jgi:cytochrome c553
MRFAVFYVSLLSAFSLLVTPVQSQPPAARQVPPDHPERARKGLELFRTTVRPVLTAKCLECHGGAAVKSDFDLSTRDALINSGFIGQSAAESQLVQLITHAAEPHMPWKLPKLSEQEISSISKWIDLGAPYDAPLGNRSEKPPAEMIVTDKDRGFWSFQPLQSPAVPDVKSAEWCRTPIDQFILAAQEAAGLQPNGTAEKKVLIRRAYAVLLGLPPTPAEVQQFVSSSDPQAWPKLIDRLLASPQYGERWARHWMDVARFAESHGYEQDYDRPQAYFYRDFLIRAFNADMPYDQFVRWQLAGDELAPEIPDAMMATGFLGAGAFPTQLTETEFESARYDELDDMVMTTGVTFLGLSVGCARCHDHKFDPIPARDYYSLAAAFTTTIRSETQLDLAPDENRQRQQAFELQLRAAKQAAADYRAEKLPDRLLDWLRENTEEQTAGPWETLHLKSVASSAGTVFQPQADGSILATGNPPAREVITLTGESVRRAVTAVRLEALTHQSLPQGGPGRAPNGNFALGNIAVAASPANTAVETPPQQIRLTQARATHQQDAGELSVAASIDDREISGWAVDRGGIGKDQAAVFEFDKPVSFDGPVRWTITLTLNHPNPQHTLGRFRLSVTDRIMPQPEVGSSSISDTVLAALKVLRTNPDRATAAWNTAISWFAEIDPGMQQHLQAIAAIEKQGPGLQLATVMVTSEGLPHLRHHADDRGFPHFYPETWMLKRGDVHQKQQIMQPGYLQVLMPAGKDATNWHIQPPSGWTRTSYRRASLAGWMTDPEQGAGKLAARVIVNRLWQHHFGKGLVTTPNDFGISGERPSHPELLEWLASDLVSHGWTLKRLQRLIMTSSTWMQSALADEQRALLDRENTLLWRRSPMRLEAEAIRDSMLAVSGLLDLQQFGPGTLDQNMKRRSIYFFIKRSQLIPMMMLFDWPEHLVSIGQRPVTTVAPQALMFMNSPQARKWASGFAGRLPADDPVAAVDTAWHLAFSRPPGTDEQQAALNFLKNQEQQHAGKGGNPRQQALTDLCQTIFSMNEFIYSE